MATPGDQLILGLRWAPFARTMLRFALSGMAVLLALLASLAPGRRSEALEIEFSGRPVKLDILALYDGRKERLPHLTRIHKFAEMPLNHLGYRLVYQDVNRKLPSVQSLGRYRGFLTWFDDPLSQPASVVDWMEAATARGLKYVVLGEVLPTVSDAQLPQVNRLLARLGLEHTGDYVGLTWGAKVLEQDPYLIGYERPVDKALPGFPIMTTRGGDAEAHLVLSVVTGGETVRSTVVATSPAGGFAASNFVMYYEANTDRDRWTINPFAFFARAFGSERRPIPDTTTLVGRRIYFSHIDGDGWNNVSEIQSQRIAQRVSAEVIEREAIIPYPDLPVSVGLIAGDTVPQLGGTVQAAVIARRLYALPQVEVATHTYTHPFNWQFFANYRRDEELRLIETLATPSISLRERFTRKVLEIAGKALPGDQTDKYIAGSDNLPRTYLREPFHLDQEVKGAIAASDALAPEGKKTELYLWSGDTTPFPAAILATRSAGVRNMNGGDSRLDAEYPSIAYVPPISRMAGDQRQIYAANSNENTYTNDWTGPYYGQLLLDTTLAKTEAPRRLKPFNLYYHMYSGEKAGALAAIKHALEKARASPVVPIAASAYAAIADDFFGVEIVQVDLFSWTISKRGALSTVRFDDASQLAVDPLRSVGVLGSNRHGQALYASLDPAVPIATVTLRSRVAEDVARRERLGNPASLVDSRWRLSNLVQSECGFQVRAQGFGTGEMTWLTAPRRGYRVTASRAGTVLSQETRWADEHGVFSLRLAPIAIEPLELAFACHE